MLQYTVNSRVLEVALAGMCVVDADDSQTVINVKRRSKKKKKNRIDRAEREGGGTVLHNCSCCAQVRLQPIRQTFAGTQRKSLTNDRAVSTAAPPSTEPVLVPPRIFSQSWLSHMLIFKLYNNSKQLLTDVEE